MKYCKDCRYFKKGKPTSDHSHCTSTRRPKEQRKLVKEGLLEACKFFNTPETIEQIKVRIGPPKVTPRWIPFHQYIRYLEEGKYFSYLRYGDGEWKGLLKEGGRNGRAHMITPEFHRDMLECLFKNAYNFSVFFGLQRNTYRAEGRQEQIDAFLKKNDLLNIPWVSAETFHHASRDGILYPLVKQMQEKNTVIVGPEFLGGLREKIFPDAFFITVPAADCYDDRERIYNEISDLAEEQNMQENVIYSFCTGPAAEVFIPRLQEELPNNFYLDTGALWDVFVGQRTRKYTQDKELYTNEIIKKNLGEIR